MSARQHSYWLPRKFFPKISSVTKLFRYRFRDFFRYQIFSNTNSDTTKKEFPGAIPNPEKSQNFSLKWLVKPLPQSWKLSVKWLDVFPYTSQVRFPAPLGNTVSWGYSHLPKMRENIRAEWKWLTKMPKKYHLFRPSIDFYLSTTAQ